MSYCTLQQLKQDMNINEVNDDALLRLIITHVDALIDSHYGFSWQAPSADSTRTFDAVTDVDGATLYVDTWLGSITTVTNGDGVVVTSSQYVTEPRNQAPYYALKLRSDASLGWTYSTYHEGAISIAGKWYYADANGLLVLGRVAIALSRWIYRQKNTSNDLDRPLISPGGVVIMPQTLPAWALGMMPKAASIL